MFFVNLQNISASSTNNLEIYINKSHDQLMFPLIDYEGKISGYKILDNNLGERVVPDADSHGVVISSRTKTIKGKDSGSAILVLNILDYLAVNTIKSNGN